jgi:hypothetical protein
VREGRTGIGTHEANVLLESAVSGQRATSISQDATTAAMSNCLCAEAVRASATARRNLGVRAQATAKASSEVPGEDATGGSSLASLQPGATHAM